MGLVVDVGPGPVGVDAAIFIYFIEEHPQYLPIIEPLFNEVSAGKQEIVTSALSLLEVLVPPYRLRNRSIASHYEALLTQSAGVHMIDISRGHLRIAAYLRAVTKTKAADALQVATALGARCTSFVTNDRDLPDIPGLRILQLSSYLRTI